MTMTHLETGQAVSTFSAFLNDERIKFRTEGRGDETWFFTVEDVPALIGKVVPIKGA